MNNHRRPCASHTFRQARLVFLAVITLALACALTIRWYTNRPIDAHESHAQTRTEAPSLQTNDSDPTHAPGQVVVPDDYYSVEGAAQRLYQPEEGRITYCPLDHHSRPTCAYGLLTTQVRTEARAQGRQEITIDPTGWPAHNTKAQIDSYHGWFWNRSHLLADSLGGAPVQENLVTGTRTQNVGGSKAHTGGMAYTETLARDWLDDPSHAQCPLYYAATPVYANDTELVPRTVVVDIESCDQSLSQHVVVHNAAKGWTIDYTTAQITKTS